MYRTQLEDIALPIEDEAVKRYVFAITKARELKIVNRWTKEILTSLNKYKPSEYPLFKEEKRMSAGRQLTTPRMLDLTTAKPANELEPAADEESPDKSEKEDSAASKSDTTARTGGKAAKDAVPSSPSGKDTSGSATQTGGGQ